MPSHLDQARSLTLQVLDRLVPRHLAQEVSIRLWDGTSWPDSSPRPATVVLRFPGALRTIFASGSERGLGEGFLRNEFDIEGDIEAVLRLADTLELNRLGMSRKLQAMTCLLKLPRGDSSLQPRQPAKLKGERHSIERDKAAVSYHYNASNDFYGLWLDKRMIYSCAYFSSPDDSLEEAQRAKLDLICRKLRLKPGQKMLDIGCGWGTLARFASVNYGAKATGITLGRNQTAWGNTAMRKAGVPEEQSKIMCMDYRDIPVPEGGYNKITCLEMAEHVGVRHFYSFIRQVYEMLDDDGVFFLQIAGLRKSWQYEDLIWGLFMNKYVFPGADASTPLGWFVDRIESAGFEVKSVDTIGVHYSATLWKWYRNWMGNRDKVEAKYGKRWFRVSTLASMNLVCVTLTVFSQIWEYFLAYSTIISRQGSATCYQLVMVKNNNSVHRVEGIPTHHGLKGALASTRADLATWAKNNAAEFPCVPASQ